LHARLGEFFEKVTLADLLEVPADVPAEAVAASVAKLVSV